MAHVKAEVDANITPFQKRLREALESAKEFGKKTKEVGVDIGKETGFGKLGTMLGLGGAAASVTAFGVAIVEAIKGGVEEAAKFQTEAFEMGTVLKDMDLGKEMTEWAENTASAVGNATDRVQALKSLLQSGLATPEDAEDRFRQFADIIAGAGGNMTELAEGFRKMSIGQGEEKTAGMQRIMKGSGAIEQMVRDDKAAYEQELRSHLAGIPRTMGTIGQVQTEQENLKRLQGMSLTDYAKEFLKPEDVTAMLERATAPGGQYFGKAQAKGETYEGAQARFKQAIAEAEQQLGQTILPTLTTWLNNMTKAIQDNAPAIKTFGEKLGQLAEFIGRIVGKTGETVTTAKEALGPTFEPIKNIALLGPAQAVGLTTAVAILNAILENQKTATDHQKQTSDILQAALGGPTL
jgi:hypothetical protein